MELVDLIWLMVRIHEVHMFDWVDYFGMDGSDLADGMDLWMNLCRMTHVGFLTTCILYVPRHVHVHTMYMNSCYFCCLGQVVPKKMCQFCLPFAVVGEGVLAAVPAAASAPSSASGFAVVHLLRTQN